jgi:hypothetical protein
VLYELLTGRVPFTASTPLGVMHQHVYEAPLRPRALKPDLPASLDAVVLRALAKDPGDRYQSAADFAAALEHAVLLEQPQPPDPLERLYQDGLRAFAAGDWELAVAKLGRIVALDPEYEDAAEILESARAAQAQAKANPRPEARAGAAAPPVPRPAAAERDALQLVRDATTERQVAPGAAPAPAQAGTPAVARRRIWPALAGAAAMLTLVAILAAIASARQPAPPQPTAIANIATVDAAPSAPADTPTPVDVQLATAVSFATEAPTSTPTDQPTPTGAPTETPQPTATPPDAVVTIELLNLRRGPGQQFQSMGSYGQGSAVELTGRDPRGDWLRVKTPDDLTGWMLADYLQVNVPLDRLPVIAPPTRTPAPPTRPPTRTPAPTDTPAPTSEPPTPVPVPPTATPEPPTSTPEPTRKREPDEPDPP